jgi:hypothetical protein
MTRKESKKKDRGKMCIIFKRIKGWIKRRK